jgi:hypothetical protein
VAERGEVRVVSTEDGHVESIIKSGEHHTMCLDWSAGGLLGWVTDTGEVWMARPADTEGRVIDTGLLRTGNPSPMWPGRPCGWSLDGSRFAAGGEGVRMYSPDGSATEAYAGDATTGTLDGFAWAPDGSALAAIEFGHVASGNTSRVVVLRGSSAKAQQIPSPDGSTVRRLLWRPDSSALYVRTLASSSSEAPGGVYLVDVETGRSNLATTNCCFAALQALPDSRFLSITNRELGADTLMVSGPDWTEERVLMRADSPGGCTGAYFFSIWLSPGGDRVAVTANAKSGPRCDYSAPY